jgi:uncharacterized protein YkwD
MIFLPLKRSALIVVVVFAAIMLTPSALLSKQDQPPIPSPEQIEKELLYLTNKERLGHGLPPLTEDLQLAQVARSHSLKMALEKKLSHGFPGYESLETRLRRGGLYFISFGENVAFSETYVSAIIHQELMDSPEHRKNIVDPEYTHCGIRVVKADDDYYITQDFGRLFTPLAAGEVEAELKQSLNLWFRDEFGYPLVFLAEMTDTARAIAEVKLRGGDIRGYVASAPTKWGQFWLHSLLSPELRRIKDEIKRKIRQIQIRGISIGAAFGRSSDYPGGTYAVAAFMFGSEYQNLSSLELSLLVLEEVNRIRRVQGAESLSLDPKLSQEALNIASIRYHTPASLSLKPGKYRFDRMEVFKVNRLARIPDYLNPFFIQKVHKSIGIGVFYPLKYGLPGNYFLVVLVCKE